MYYKLSDLTIDGKGSYGIAASAVEYNANKYTYLRITDINDDGTINFEGLKSVDDENADKYLLKENDIVFARTGASTGRTYFYQKKDGVFVFAGFLIKYSLDPNKVNPRFLKYYTHSKTYYDWVHSFDSGATRGNINAKTFGNMLIDLPKRYVQDKIVSILSSLDDKIAVNKKICENLEAQAQALFKHWFVDFAPFKDGKFVESELGLIPEGWSLIPFSDFLTPSNERVGKVGVPEYSVTNTGIHPRSDTFNKSLSKDSSKNKLLRKNNLVFGMSREILNWGIMKEEEGGVSSAYHIYIVDTEQVNATYLGEFIKFNIKYFHDLIKPASREGQGHDRNALYNKYVYVPPKSILDDFLNICVMLKESILSYKQESSRLSTLRDTLLPKLMSGEIKVNEITL